MVTTTDNTIIQDDINVIRSTVNEMLRMSIRLYGTDEIKDRFENVPDLFKYVDEPITILSIRVRCKMALEVADKLERGLRWTPAS